MYVLVVRSIGYRPIRQRVLIGELSAFLAQTGEHRLGRVDADVCVEVVVGARTAVVSGEPSQVQVDSARLKAYAG